VPPGQVEDGRQANIAVKMPVQINQGQVIVDHGHGERSFHESEQSEFVPIIY
jgi:hypothetical protein